MAKVGRPEKLNPEIQQAICDALEKGSYIETAAAKAGISKTTLYDWLKKGARAKDENGEYEEGLLPYVEFSNAIEKAMAAGEQNHVDNIARHAKENWQASAWMLERKFPERWGKKAIMRLEDPDKPSGAFTEESFNAILADEVERLESELPDDEKQFED